MTRRSVVLAVAAVVLILFGVWIVFLSGRKLTLSLPVSPHEVAVVGNSEAPRRDAPVPATSIKPAEVGGLWMRPSAKVAARNLRRCSLGTTLKPVGANDSIIERIVDGDMRAAVAELEQRARAGNASAGNQLAYIAHLSCAFVGNHVAQSYFQESQLIDANGLSPADRDWLRAAIRERQAYNEELSSVCEQSVDKSETESWVATSAAQGNAASQYMLFLIGLTTHQSAEVREAELQAASLGGYPWAQFGVAQPILQGAPPAPGASTTIDNAVDLLRAAAGALPEAESYLAQCEFKGCANIPVDIASAVAHAQEAAENGALEAMLEIGPQLQASQIDPDEVEAWNLIHAALEMQGYAGKGFTVQMVKSTSAALNSPTITSRAKALADQYWQEYGARILESLGCGSGAVAARSELGRKADAAEPLGAFAPEGGSASEAALPVSGALH